MHLALHCVKIRDKKNVMINDKDTLENEEIEIEAIGIEVSSQPIELYKVLKIANLVDGGGQAKFLISDGYVAVNGELETRKRRKMYNGDFLEFNQEYYVVLCDQPVTEVLETDVTSVVAATNVPKPKQKASETKPARNKPTTTKKENSDAPNSKDIESGRNSIDFF
ncbi:RNA-binding S4 domain-containing protein [Vibrio sp. 1151_11]|uniref:RNA-binding S4 domain-containing protein n=1 Tax=Vibrio sp. 1151_11 TaxID=2527670 RepID=UPI002407171F|nr:RNA-binding S4 domain-containing protein [Vibrio sp. 1151_11]MDF9389681.1 RNA-binding S4 domain-containing protein [Vibrio sp. 1151_11]